jgi:hypothetical protein
MSVRASLLWTMGETGSGPKTDVCLDVGTIRVLSVRADTIDRRSAISPDG